MSYYLYDHPNPNSRIRDNGIRFWGHPNRRKTVHIIAVHTAETAPNLESAEAVAHYFTISERPASYHEIVDADSHVALLPPWATAFGARGWNSNVWHISFATHARMWGDNPAWDDAALRRGADRARQAAARFGIPTRRITLAEAERGERGFIDHSRLDPDRRSDPGGGFPWQRFLELVTDQEDDSMAMSEDDLRRIIHDEVGKVVVDHDSGMRLDTAIRHTRGDVRELRKRVEYDNPRLRRGLRGALDALGRKVKRGP